MNHTNYTKPSLNTRKADWIQITECHVISPTSCLSALSRTAWDKFRMTPRTVAAWNRSYLSAPYWLPCGEHKSGWPRTCNFSGKCDSWEALSASPFLPADLRSETRVFKLWKKTLFRRKCVFLSSERKHVFLSSCGKNISSETCF